MALEKTGNANLVVEVIDALLNPAYDGVQHGRYQKIISDYLAIEPRDAANRELLLAEETLQSRSRMNQVDFCFDDNAGAKEIAERLKERLPRWPYYLYHGTPASRLPSIAASGLQPAYGRPAWKKLVPHEYLEKGIFFTTSWRTAIDWAAASITARDGKLKEGHAPAVVRVSAEPLFYFPDAYARMNDCLVVKGSVSVNYAYYFAGIPEGTPTWHPLIQAP